MFLQKLKLDENMSYSTTGSLENIIENLHLSFKHIPVLTPFLSSADSEADILKNLSKEMSISTMTPAMFSKLAHSFDCTHAVLQERDLMEKFCLNISNLPKPVIELGNTKNHSLLLLCKMNLPYKNEDSFVVLFILSKLYTGKLVTKNPKKFEIFFKVFNIEWEILSYDNDLSVNSECTVFTDGCIECSAERVFCINKSVSGLQSLKIDLSLAGKYKTRISELYRAITPAIMKGHREFNYERYESLKQ